MEEEDIGRFRSSFARSMVDAGIERPSSLGDDEFGHSTVDDDFGTEITSLGSGGGRTSWSAASWSPLPAASPPRSASPGEPHFFLESTRVPASNAASPECPTTACTAAATLLRVQIESLTWQLNQMDVGYKMQKVVLQQILSFLERLPSDLSSLNGESTWRGTSHTCSKCGSVQALPALGSTRRNSLELSSRNLSLCDTPVNGSYTIRPGSSFDNSPLRDIPWRRRRRESSSSAERIGSEAQRLLRTVRSVLAATTPENFLVASHAENNSISGRSTNLNSSQQTNFSNPSSSCLPPPRSGEGKASSGAGLSESEEEAFRLVSEGGQRLWEGQRAWGGRQNAMRSRGPKVLQTSASSSSSSSKSYDCQAEPSLNGNQKERLIIPCRERLPEEEESGFSSLGSFQEGVKNERVVRGSFHEVGLPDCSKSEGLTVLWV